MPRATSKGETATSREMVDRFSLANGTAVQIHWPSEIETIESEDLYSWAQLIVRKIMRAAGIPESSLEDMTPTGYPQSDPDATQQPDWKEQRDRTKAAMADRIVEVPKQTGPSAWDAKPMLNFCQHCGMSMQYSYEASMGLYCPKSANGLHSRAVEIPAFDPSTIQPPPPTELRQYFNGCHCASCTDNYRVEGTQYVDATMPGFDEHMALQRQPIVTLNATLYYQGCKCEQCKANRAVGTLVWGGSVEHASHIATHMANVPAISIQPGGAYDDREWPF